MISPLHFITQDNAVPYQEQVEAACKAGVDWVQFRSKILHGGELIDAAESIVAICKTHGITCIVNDHVGLAAEAAAHGVHLGQNDMSPSQARKLLGPDAIIGGTANTPAQAMRMVEAGVDYLGIGPFRYTLSKEALSPVLGPDGIKRIVEAVDSRCPVIAIGGIELDDVATLLTCRVNGVAVSGAIASKKNIEAAASAFVDALALNEQTVK